MTDQSYEATMATISSHDMGGNDGFSSPLSSPPSSLPPTPNALGQSPPESKKNVTPVTGKRKRGATTATKKKPSPYYDNNKQNEFPEPYGQPPVWSEKRQGLCEALPYYNAYQSGAYTSNKMVYGFLCDGEVGDRDHFTDQIIIARVGGGKTLNEDTGKQEQTKSQDDCTLAVAFRKNQEMNHPVVVIAGQGHSRSPCKLPHYYNVLDYFQVQFLWPEQFNFITRWMVRLEKIDLEEKSWWSAKDAHHSPPNFISPKTPQQECPVCKVVSKTIYKQGWVCLNADPVKEGKSYTKTTCPAFFKFSEDIDDKTLEYTKEFLEERTPFKLAQGQVLEPLVPPFLSDADANILGALAFEEKCRKGIVCSQCNCCIRRIHWGFWKCENPNCNFVRSLTPRLIPASLAISDSRQPKPKEQTFVYRSIRFNVSHRGGFEVTIYVLPGEEEDSIAGWILHYKSNPSINQSEGGPDDLFLELQTADLGLKRNPSKNPNARNEVLTAHYAHNWGAPYKYSVAQNSTGFEHAKPAIINALKRLTWAGREAVAAVTDSDEGKDFKPFNEMLSVGYFENSHMGYHDDGESTVGPTVASLSLGCSSTMSWRPKASSKIESENEKNNQKGEKRDVLRIVLRQGDMMVMHGSNIQKFYEHSVTPHGRLRFALTSRYIVPASLADDAARKAAEIAARLPDWSRDYEYDGDINAMVPTHALPSPPSLLSAPSRSSTSSLSSPPNRPRLLLKLKTAQKSHEKVATAGTFAPEQDRDLYLLRSEGTQAMNPPHAAGMISPDYDTIPYYYQGPNLSTVARRAGAIPQKEFPQQHFGHENYERTSSFAEKAPTMHSSYNHHHSLDYQPSMFQAASIPTSSSEYLPSRAEYGEYSNGYEPTMTQAAVNLAFGNNYLQSDGEYHEYTNGYEPTIEKAAGTLKFDNSYLPSHGEHRGYNSGHERTMTEAAHTLTSDNNRLLSRGEYRRYNNGYEPTMTETAGTLTSGSEHLPSRGDYQQYNSTHEHMITQATMTVQAQLQHDPNYYDYDNNYDYTT